MGRRGRHAQPSDSTFLAAAATGRGQTEGQIYVWLPGLVCACWR